MIIPFSKSGIHGKVMHLSKTVALDWNAYMEGKILPKNHSKMNTARKTAATIHLFLFPKAAFAAVATDSTWMELLTTVLNIGDWLCVGVIVFAGVTWMFGNRTKALELLMGGSAGYLIIRHAVDIRNWLKTI
jgi:type IV secretory pathway VirB2 component (pilin)